MNRSWAHFTWSSVLTVFVTFVYFFNAYQLLAFYDKNFASKTSIDPIILYSKWNRQARKTFELKWIKDIFANFFLFPALGTFTNCSGYLLHRNYGQYAFFNSTSETGPFNEKKTNNVSEKSLATKYVFFSYVWKIGWNGFFPYLRFRRFFFVIDNNVKGSHWLDLY